MKDNIQTLQTALLILIAGTVIYGTFIKDSSSSTSSHSKRRSERTSKIAAPTPPPPSISSKTTAPVQNNPAMPTTKIAFDKMAHDFGTINQDSENNMVFTFTNTGDKPLVIESATGSCGCTVPEFPKEPIAPGQTSEIKVVYKPGKQKGLQNKTVTVIANTVPKDTRLNISANVIEVQ